jgi:hypothetical protein
MNCQTGSILLRINLTKQQTNNVCYGRAFNQKKSDMKKIININLSGRVIMIEDSAYEKLKAYIDSLRQYFSKEEGVDEIINDIESRIAELMNDKIRKGAAAIKDEHIEEIATHMGRPEDLAAEEANDYEFLIQQAGKKNVCIVIEMINSLEEYVAELLSTLEWIPLL